MSVANKLKKAGFWQSITIIIQVVVQFTYIAVMARLLTKGDFGLMALASSFIGFGTIFSEGGMGAALIQRQNISQRHMNAAFQSSMLIGFLLFLVFLASANSLAAFFKEPELGNLIRVAAVNLILSAVGSVSVSLLQKNFKFKLISIVNTIVILISYSLGIIYAYKGFGVWSMIIASLCQTILNAGLMFYFAPVKLSPRIHFKEWKELFSFSSGMILLKMLNYFSGSGLNLVLGKIFSPSMLGVFERANKIKTLPSDYLGKILDTIMFPTMAEIQDEEERLFKTYQFSLGLVNSILMPIAFILVLFSREIVLLMLGKNWEEAIVPLQILFVVLPFASSGRMADSVIRAKGLVYKNVYRKLIYVFVLILSTGFGAYFYGITGAAIGVSFSYLFNYYIMLILVKSIFKKSIAEIFLQPVYSGIVLSATLLIPAIISIFALNSLKDKPLWYLISNLIIIGIFAGLIILKKKSILGVYILEFLKRFKIGKKKKIAN